jgi:endonuclease YncB( thermonuclease family)
VPIRAPAAVDTIEGHPRVVDVDTLAFGKDRVRLWGIDAPEAAQECQRNGEPYDAGGYTRLVLRTILQGERVVCDVLDTDSV